MTDYFSEKFFDGLMKVAKQVDDENQENFKKLEDELKTAQTQYKEVVQQNKGLQTERNVYRKTLENIREFTESIYEQIPEDRVLRQILLKINEVLQ